MLKKNSVILGSKELNCDCGAENNQQRFGNEGEED